MGVRTTLTLFPAGVLCDEGRNLGLVVPSSRTLLKITEQSFCTGIASSLCSSSGCCFSNFPREERRCRRKERWKTKQNTGAESFAFLEASGLFSVHVTCLQHLMGSLFPVESCDFSGIPRKGSGQSQPRGRGRRLCLSVTRDSGGVWG